MRLGKSKTQSPSQLQSQSFKPNCQKMKLQISVYLSTSFDKGVPTPWPALVSKRKRMGLSADVAAHRAVIFKACMGSTRVSDSAVKKSVAG